MAEYWQRLEDRAKQAKDKWVSVKRATLWLLLTVAFLSYYLLSKLHEAFEILG